MRVIQRQKKKKKRRYENNEACEFLFRIESFKSV